MPIELQEEAPYFDRSRFERECFQPDCEEGHIMFHFAQLSQAPRSGGHTLSIMSKCTNPDCGGKDRYEPVIVEETKAELRERFGGPLYIPWSDEHVDDHEAEMESVYTDDERELIEDHLADLGYF